MLDRITGLLQTHPDKAAFFRVVANYYAPTSFEYREIDRAYNLAKVLFEGKSRDNGIERYFEHLRRVTLIAILYLHCFEMEMECEPFELIIALLFHDVPEDIKGWDANRVGKEFNDVSATLVWHVTKPDLADFGGSRPDRNRFYHQRLLEAPREAMLIKLPDRQDNCMTLWPCTEEKQRRKVQETLDHYLILAKRHGILVYELLAACDAVTNELKNK